jgi:hypothetical protein
MIFVWVSLFRDKVYVVIFVAFNLCNSFILLLLSFYKKNTENQHSILYSLIGLCLCLCTIGGKSGF